MEYIGDTRSSFFKRLVIVLQNDSLQNVKPDSIPNKFLSSALSTSSYPHRMAGTGPCSGRGLEGGPQFRLPSLEVLYPFILEHVDFVLELEPWEHLRIQVRV